MKKIILKLLLSITIFTMLVVPVEAAVGIPEYLIPKETPLRKLNTEILKKGKEDGIEATTVGANAVLQFIANALLYVAGPLAILFVAHAGQNYAFAFGEQSKIEAAKRQLTWAILGLGVVLISYIIVRWLISAVFLISESSIPPPQESSATEEKK